MWSFAVVRLARQRIFQTVTREPHEGMILTQLDQDPALVITRVAQAVDRGFCMCFDLWRGLWYQQVLSLALADFRNFWDFGSMLGQACPNVSEMVGKFIGAQAAQAVSHAPLGLAGFLEPGDSGKQKGSRGA